VKSIGTRNVQRILVGKPYGNCPLGRLRRKWEDKIKINCRDVGRRRWEDIQVNIRDVGCEDQRLMGLVHDHA